MTQVSEYVIDNSWSRLITQDSPLAICDWITLGVDWQLKTQVSESIDNSRLKSRSRLITQGPTLGTQGPTLAICDSQLNSLNTCDMRFTTHTSSVGTHVSTDIHNSQLILQDLELIDYSQSIHNSYFKTWNSCLNTCNMQFTTYACNQINGYAGRNIFDS